MEKLVPVKPKGWQKRRGKKKPFREEPGSPLHPFRGRCGGRLEDIFLCKPSWEVKDW